jgi:catechol 2,3-dioxygenase-like lactoylglutathione lyase family enzyme
MKFMPVLNHHIVAARDQEATAWFFADVVGLEPPFRLGEFAVVRVSADTTLDFITVTSEIHQQHYAFLATEGEFDAAFARIKDRQISYWADPFRKEPNRINEWDDGRGVYFDDPNGHLLELLTRPYGSAGTAARHPHPLIAPPLEPKSPNR